jgi:hypothetical protein
MSKQLPSTTPTRTKDSQWQSKLNTLEYSVATSTLFDELFMNKEKKIMLGNLKKT